MIMSCFGNGLLKKGLHGLLQGFRIPDGCQTDAIFKHFLNFRAKVFLQQAHESFDFARGPEPVFCRKGIEGQNLDTDFPAGSHRESDRFRALLVPSNSSHRVLLGPPAISIHDNGNMPGQFLKIDFGHYRAKFLRY